MLFLIIKRGEETYSMKLRGVEEKDRSGGGGEQESNQNKVLWAEISQNHLYA